jgi:hypothetical protein
MMETNSYLELREKNFGGFNRMHTLALGHIFKVNFNHLSSLERLNKA